MAKDVAENLQEVENKMFTFSREHLNLFKDPSVVHHRQT